MLAYLKSLSDTFPSLLLHSWPCGAMDNASAYGAEDSRFDPWQGRWILSGKDMMVLGNWYYMEGT